MERTLALLHLSADKNNYMNEYQQDPDPPPSEQLSRNLTQAG
jgi:hypothetical protein